jgi:hypothetical protein
MCDRPSQFQHSREKRKKKIRDCIHLRPESLNRRLPVYLKSRVPFLFVNAAWVKAGSPYLRLS